MSQILGRFSLLEIFTKCTLRDGLKSFRVNLTRIENMQTVIKNTIAKIETLLHKIAGYSYDII